MKTTKLFILIYVLSLSTIFSQEHGTKETNSLVQSQIQVVPIKDKKAQKNYELYVELPANYSENPDRTYPVLYYTDAMWHLEMLSGSSEFILENLILVGISWQKGISDDLMEKYGAHASRFTDYSFWKKSNPNHPLLKFGQAEHHLEFIRNEVITYVDNNYRTDPNSRSYFGYSLSGAFGAYILLTQPDTFNNYILGSPLNKGLLPYLTEINSELVTTESDKKLHANVFIAYGSLEENKEEPVEGYINLFDDRKNLDLSIQNKTIKGNHQTAFPRVAVESMAWLSSLIKPTASDDYDESFWDIPHLNNPFVSTTPEDRKDGILVDTLTVNSKDQNAILKLSQEIFEDKHGNYDAVLISHKDKLVFESYYKKGRLNLPHGQASATKGYTSLILGRAIQLGYLSMDDLDRPLVDFLKDLDPPKFTDGAEKITLHKALTMRGGLTIDRDQWKKFENDSIKLKGQGLVQTLLEQSQPITDESQTYLYGNFNPMLVMTVIDAVAPNGAESFIKNEVLDKLGITDYKWETHVSGLPQAGWMVSMTSRDMLKWGSLVLNKGKWNGEQLISADYLEKATSPIIKPKEDWMPKEYRYGYFWYHTPIAIGNKNYEATFAWGGGGQRVIVVEELDLVIVISGHDRDDNIMTPITKTIIPAFVN